MSKRLAIAVVACACVAVAFGAARKIKLFVPNPIFESADADGMAILNFIPGGNTGNERTSFQLILSDFQPNTDYDLLLIPSTSMFVPNVDGGTLSNSDLMSITAAPGSDELTTDSKGRLTFHKDLTGLNTNDFSDRDVLIFTNLVSTRLDEGDPMDPFDDVWMLEGEFRARGSQSP
ncbi:MAG: hypothetical protein IH986_13595 [Planctomycetes bacterium]|nr:hypothetical protein [Planctomycetota bacterium]